MMRWAPQTKAIPDWLAWALLSPILAAAMVVLLPLLVLGWIDGIVRGTCRWGRWFAWHPITIGDWLHDNETRVWFEWVERYRGGAMWDWQYRPAQGIEAAPAAETVKLGSVHESPVAKPCAQTPPDKSL